MRKRNGVIFAIFWFIILFFFMEGWGADWKYITKDIQGGVWEIDVESISRQPNNIVRAWSKITHTKEGVDISVKQFGEQYKDLSYTVALEEYHCKEKKNRILRLAAYSSDGGIIDSDNSPSGEWTFVIPGSMADRMLKEVCK